MLSHSGGIAGFNSLVAYLAADDVYIAVLANDREFSAAAGLWVIAQKIRAYQLGSNG